MKKIINFCKKYFRGILFALVTAIFATGMSWMEPTWCVALFFAELIAGQILTRSLVNAQIRSLYDIQNSQPRAFYLVILGFLILISAFSFTAHNNLREFVPLTRLTTGILIGLIFFYLYWIQTEADRKRYHALMKMTKEQWRKELEKIQKAEEDIRRAQKILTDSPLY